MKAFFKMCGVLGVNHVAVTTPDFNSTMDTWLGLPGAKLKKEPGWNESQQVEYGFVQVTEGLDIEILGARGASPIEQHIKKGGGPYHFCFDVKNIELAISGASSFGAVPISEAKADPAFAGKKVCFMFHQALGVFEFVER